MISSSIARGEAGSTASSGPKRTSLAAALGPSLSMETGFYLSLRIGRQANSRATGDAGYEINREQAKAARNTVRTSSAWHPNRRRPQPAPGVKSLLALLLVIAFAGFDKGEAFAQPTTATCGSTSST